MIQRIFSKPLFKYTLIAASIAASAMSALPLLSVYSGGTESGTFIIRGFNLMEFCAWGVVPMIAPLLISVILFGHQSKAAQEIKLITLLVGNTVAYVHGFNATRAWISEIGGRITAYHPGMIILPIALIVVLAIAKVFTSFQNSIRMATRHIITIYSSSKK